jgi:hypothetical protein
MGWGYLEGLRHGCTSAAVSCLNWNSLDSYASVLLRANNALTQAPRVRIPPSPFCLLGFKGFRGFWRFLCTLDCTCKGRLPRLPLRPGNDAAILGLLMHVNDELAGWHTVIVLLLVFLLPGSDGGPPVGLGAGRRSFWRRLTLRALARKCLLQTESRTVG